MAELASTNAEARRLVLQGAVRIDGEAVRDLFATVPGTRGTSCLVQVGKPRFARIVFD